jgi:hypothetical protein
LLKENRELSHVAVYDLAGKLPLHSDVDKKTAKVHPGIQRALEQRPQKPVTLFGGELSRFFLCARRDALCLIRFPW